MRWLLGLLMAGIAASAQTQVVQAQDLGFGSYPAGITSGSPYGFYPGGYVPGRVTYTSPYGPYTAPGMTYYSSRYYGGTPGTATYGPGVNYSSPNAAAYGYSAPLYPTARYYTTPSYQPYYPARSWGGGGLFRRQAYGW